MEEIRPHAVNLYGADSDSERIEFEMQTDILTLLENVKCQGTNIAGVKQAFSALSDICSSNGNSQNYFMRAGGIRDTMDFLLDDDADASVIPAALFCLACAVGANAEAQDQVLGSGFLSKVRQFLSSKAGKVVGTGAFVLASIVSGNERGQRLAYESSCLAALLKIIRSDLQNFCSDYQKWDFITRAIRKCVSHPQNEKNQSFCCSLLPHAFKFISSEPHNSCVIHILSLVTSFVDSNVFNQNRLRTCGGLEELVGLVKLQIEDGVEDPKISVAAVAAIDASILDNELSGKQVGDLGIVSIIFDLIGQFELTSAELKTLLLAIAHVLEQHGASSSEITKDQLVDLMASSEDAEIFKTIKYICTLRESEFKRLDEAAWEDQESESYVMRRELSSINQKIDALQNQLNDQRCQNMDIQMSHDTNPDKSDMQPLLQNGLTTFSEPAQANFTDFIVSDQGRTSRGSSGKRQNPRQQRAGSHLSLPNRDKETLCAPDLYLQSPSTGSQCDCNGNTRLNGQKSNQQDFCGTCSNNKNNNNPEHGRPQTHHQMNNNSRMNKFYEGNLTHQQSLVLGQGERDHLVRCWDELQQVAGCSSADTNQRTHSYPSKAKLQPLQICSRIQPTKSYHSTSKDNHATNGLTPHCINNEDFNNDNLAPCAPTPNTSNCCSRTRNCDQFPVNAPSPNKKVCLGSVEGPGVNRDGLLVSDTAGNTINPQLYPRRKDNCFQEINLLRQESYSHSQPCTEQNCIQCGDNGHKQLPRFNIKDKHLPNCCTEGNLPSHVSNASSNEKDCDILHDCSTDKNGNHNANSLTFDTSYAVDRISDSVKPTVVLDGQLQVLEQVKGFVGSFLSLIPGNAIRQDNPLGSSSLRQSTSSSQIDKMDGGVQKQKLNPEALTSTCQNNSTSHQEENVAKPLETSDRVIVDKLDHASSCGECPSIFFPAKQNGKESKGRDERVSEYAETPAADMSEKPQGPETPDTCGDQRNEQSADVYSTTHGQCDNQSRTSDQCDNISRILQQCDNGIKILGHCYNQSKTPGNCDRHAFAKPAQPALHSSQKNPSRFKMSNVRRASSISSNRSTHPLLSKPISKQLPSPAISEFDRRIISLAEDRGQNVKSLVSQVPNKNLNDRANGFAPRGLSIDCSYINVSKNNNVSSVSAALSPRSTLSDSFQSRTLVRSPQSTFSDYFQRKTHSLSSCSTIESVESTSSHCLRGKLQASKSICKPNEPDSGVSVENMPVVHGKAPRVATPHPVKGSSSCLTAVDQHARKVLSTRSREEAPSQVLGINRGCPGCMPGQGLNSRTMNIAMEHSKYTCDYHRTLRLLERKFIRHNLKSLNGSACNRSYEQESNISNDDNPLRNKEDVYTFNPRDEEIDNPVVLASVQTALGRTVKHSPRKKVKSRRPRVPYTEQELANLEEGVQCCGKRWQQILWTYEFHPSRTAVDLKDKYRNLLKAGQDDYHQRDIQFSMCEIRRLKRGVKTYGFNWEAILSSSKFLPGRTPTDLKDKWKALNRSA